jgi:nitrogen fixation protein NifU and related proteins
VIAYIKKEWMMSGEIIETSSSTDGIREMLSNAGYSDKAIQYYLEKPYMGSLPDADQVSEMTGTCGDTMAVYLNVSHGKIADVMYQVMGCAGAISAAMAAVDLVKGKKLQDARNLDDGDIFRVLEEIPVKKHHCIQLAVKALHKTIDAYQKDHPV